MSVEKSDIQALVRDFSIETTPKSAVNVGDFGHWLAPQTRVYVTFLPSSPLDATLETSIILKAQGMNPVPHLAVRSIESEAQLHYALGRLADAKVDNILLIAGAVRNAKGPYTSVQKVLQSNILNEYPISSIGFAGHPEGSPDIPPAEVDYAEAIKRAYALNHPREYHLVSQFVFDAKPVIAWQERLNERNIVFPLHVGVPGLATIKTLIKHAKACGVGPSMMFLIKSGHGIRHLMGISTPDKLIYDLAAYNREHPETSLIKQLHFYPLGGFQQTVEWIKAIEQGQFTLTETGFYVH
ncbi:metFprotein [Suttonella sp. R2A3]|uniref:metFprotein n=1 Tax=Suttonella sp. R2A3 TaxID=2908648 RepID=UPI001F32B4CC|nr:metFprotein [Suttonella sp. R2A3]UJF24318.1 metFprotein [Suttonella sp. R2A3]